MTETEAGRLIDLAIAARERAYAPYSGYKVGAALLADGKLYTGCNVENASYGASNCAERTAAFAAVADGSRHFQAIAIVGGREGDALDYAWPCGICRQVLSEFADEHLQVLVARSGTDYQVCSLEDLFAHGFQLEPKEYVSSDDRR